MRVLLSAEYKEQLAVAEKLYEVQAPLRAAQAEEDARLQQLEAEEEQRKNTQPKPVPNHCHTWCCSVFDQQSMIVDGVFEGSDTTEGWYAQA